LDYEVPGLSSAVQKLKDQLAKAFPNVPHAEWIAMRLLQGDPRMVSAVATGELSRLGGSVPVRGVVEELANS
jgi:ferrous iron transport protein B